jgi:hypothetical protein
MLARDVDRGREVTLVRLDATGRPCTGGAGLKLAGAGAALLLEDGGLLFGGGWEVLGAGDDDGGGLGERRLRRVALSGNSEAIGVGGLGVRKLRRVASSGNSEAVGVLLGRA